MAGRLQLNTVGNNIIFPYDEPQFSHFSQIFNKHTNFARKNFHIKYDNIFKFGGLTTINVPQNSGDLLNKVILKVTLPQIPSIPGGYDPDGNYSPNHNENNVYQFQPVRICYQESVGHALIEYVDLKIGNQIIERITGETLQIHSEISDDSGKQIIYNKLINKFPDPSRRDACSSVLVALNNNDGDFNIDDNELAGFTGDLEMMFNIPFYFSKNPKLYLPICSIYKQEISFDIKFRNFEDIIVEYIKPNYYTATYGVPWFTFGVNEVNNDLKKYLKDIEIKDGDFIIEQTFLDNIEKIRLKNRKTDYLMTETQLQTFDMNEEIGKIPEKQFNLSFKNPVIELYFVIQRKNGVDIGTNNTTLSGTDLVVRGFTYVTQFDYDNSSDAHVEHQDIGDYDSTSKERPLAHSGTWDNLEYLTLTLDGNDIITREIGDYLMLGTTQFNLHHKRTPQSRRFYMYSFALKPDEWEPSGYLNFSNIKNQILNIRLFSSEIFMGKAQLPGIGHPENPTSSVSVTRDTWYVFPRILRVYAKSYNILRVKDGVATKLF